MTLVVSLISADHVIQVSDRRLVWLRGRQIVDEDDNRNKAVIWCNRLAFAYTGFAELGTESRTDLWIASTLSAWAGTLPPDKQKQDAVVAALAKAAATELSNKPFRDVPRDRRQHAFVGAGWACFDGATDFEPYIATMANYRGKPGNPTPAEDEFEVGIQRLPEDKKIWVNWMGQDLGEREVAALDGLNGMLRDPTTFGLSAAGLLADQVRSVAARNRTVGRGLLISALPRSAIVPGQAENILLAGPPEEGQLTFLYVPPDEDEGVQYGPTYVCGQSTMANFEARSL
jgi:hypothetical protein